MKQLAQGHAAGAWRPSLAPAPARPGRARTPTQGPRLPPAVYPRLRAPESSQRCARGLTPGPSAGDRPQGSADLSSG